MSHPYRNKLDVAERGKEVRERRLVWGRGKEGEGGLGGETSWTPFPPCGTFSDARGGTIKYNLTAALQAGKECFFCLFQIKMNYAIQHTFL